MKKQQKLAKKLKEIFAKAVKKVKEIFTGIKGNSRFEKYRKRMEEMTSKYPWICENCGEEMILWKIHVPGYGVSMTN